MAELPHETIERFRKAEHKIGYEKGVKDFAKFLIDKGIDGVEISDLVIEFLEKGK